MKKLLIVDVPESVMDFRAVTVDFKNGEQWFGVHDITEFTPAEIDYLLTLHRMNENGKHFAPVPDIEDKLKQLR